MKVNTKSILKKNIVKLVARAILFIFVIVTLYPFIWNLLSSFKTNSEFMSEPFKLPAIWHWENYIKAIKVSNIAQNVWNSLYVVLVCLVVTLACVVPCTYCLIRYKFIGSSLIMRIFMTCLFVSGNYILTPLFLQMSRLHLLNNLTALGLVYAAFRIPFSVFLLSGYMSGIPKDYEEAAILDGCTPFGVLRRIIIPLCKPGIITISMLAIMFAWNEYAMAMAFLMKSDKQTLPVGLVALQQVQEYATDWVVLFAAMMIALIPTIILYAVCKKHLMEGMQMGGLKG